MNTLVATESLRVNQVLSPHMGVFFVAFLVTFLATPLMRLLATRKGIVDWPDLHRKAHLEPVAYLGGVAILLGWAAAVIACRLLSSDGDSGHPWFSAVSFPFSIILGAIAIVVTGLIDDVHGVSPRIKIGGQLLSAGFLAHQRVDTQLLGAKLVADSLAVVDIQLSYPWAYVLGTILIAVFVLGGCNSVNLLDGLDGLAAGVTAIAGMGFLFLSTYAAMNLTEAVEGAWPLRVVMCFALLGALIGFLPYNFSPANIFMGDAGSLLVGYLCVSTILMFTTVGTTPAGGPRGPLYVMAALIIFALPITDTTLAILRRRLRGKAVYSPDNQHMHHQILQAFTNLRLSPGMSAKLAVMTLYLIAAVFAVLGCSMVYLRGTRYVLAVFLVIFSFVAVMAYKVGHRAALLDQLKKGEHSQSLVSVEPASGGDSSAPGPGDEPKVAG